MPLDSSIPTLPMYMAAPRHAVANVPGFPQQCICTTPTLPSYIILWTAVHICFHNNAYARRPQYEFIILWTAVHICLACACICIRTNEAAHTNEMHSATSFLWTAVHISVTFCVYTASNTQHIALKTDRWSSKKSGFRPYIAHQGNQQSIHTLQILHNTTDRTPLHH